MKERILMVAAQEMKERGIKFTMEEVSLKLGISKKTLYQYYPSKDQLISAGVDAVIQDMEDQVTAIMGSPKDFATRLIELVTLEPKVFGKIPDWVREDIRRYRSRDWERITRFREKEAGWIVQVLEEGIAAGLVRSISAPVAAKILFSACNGLMEYEFLQSNNLTLSEGVQQLKEIFLYGVLGAGGKAEVSPGELTQPAP